MHTRSTSYIVGGGGGGLCSIPYIAVLLKTARWALASLSYPGTTGRVTPYYICLLCSAWMFTRKSGNFSQRARCQLVFIHRFMGRGGGGRGLTRRHGGVQVCVCVCVVLCWSMKYRRAFGDTAVERHHLGRAWCWRNT